MTNNRNLRFTSIYWEPREPRFIGQPTIEIPFRYVGNLGNLKLRSLAIDLENLSLGNQPCPRVS